MDIEDQRGSTGAHTDAGTKSVPGMPAGPRPAPHDQDAERVDARELDPAQLDRICLFNLLSACADTIFFKDLASRFIRVSQSQAELTGAEWPGTRTGLPAKLLIYGAPVVSMGHAALPGSGG